MADYSSITYDPGDTLKNPGFSTAIDKAADRDHATPEEWAGDHANYYVNVLSAIVDELWADPRELTIDTGAIDVTAAQGGVLHVDTDGDGASDDLDTITNSGGTYVHRKIRLRAEHADRTVVVKHNTGNILCPDGADISLTDTNQYVELFYDADDSKWVVVGIAAGDSVGGPASSTDNALARWDGAGGDTVQDSGWTLTDAHALTAAGNLDMSAGAYDILLKDNEAAALEVKEGANAYLAFVTTDAGEKVLVSKSLEADAGIDLDGNLDASTQATTLSILDNNAAALDIKEAANSYLKFVTTDAGEKVIIGQELDIDDGVVDLSTQATVLKVIDNDAAALDIQSSDGTSLLKIISTDAGEYVDIWNMLNMRAEGGSAYFQALTYADGAGGIMSLARARDTEASPDVLQDGDEIGRIQFKGYDGDSWATAAYIRAYVDGTPGDADMPTRLEFWTTADGAGSPTRRGLFDCEGAFQLDNCTLTAADADSFKLGAIDYTAGNTQLNMYSEGALFLAGTSSQAGAIPVYANGVQYYLMASTVAPA